MNEINKSNFENKILRELFTSKEILLFTLYRRLNTTPGKVIEAINNLSSKKMLLYDIDSTTVKITTKGEEFCITNLKKPDLKQSVSTYDSNNISRVEINSFYIPIKYKK